MSSRLLFFLFGGATGILTYGMIFLIFVKCGLLCFGGGMVLVPVYLEMFVGPDARYLQLEPEDSGRVCSAVWSAHSVCFSRRFS